MDNTRGFYPHNVGSIPARQAIVLMKEICYGPLAALCSGIEFGSWHCESLVLPGTMVIFQSSFINIMLLSSNGRAVFLQSTDGSSILSRSTIHFPL